MSPDATRPATAAPEGVRWSADAGSGNGRLRPLDRALDELAYPFTKEYQRKILALMLRRRDFLPLHAHMLRPKHFTTPLFQDTARLILRFYDTYREVPSKEGLDQLLTNELGKLETRLPKGIPEEWRRLIEELWSLDLRDGKGIGAQVTEWVKDRAFEQAIVQVAGLVDRAKRTGTREYEQARSFVAEALRLGVERTVLAVDYFEETHARLIRLVLSNPELDGRIATLFPSLDRALDGGPQRGEITVWAAPPSRGKSACLVWVAKAAVYLGRNVLFVTSEMSGRQIESRLDRAIAQMTKAEMREQPQEAKARIEAAHRWQGNLRIVELFGTEATVEGIRLVVERLKAEQEFEPDVLVVDYPGVMRAMHSYEHRRDELAEIFRDLRSLGKELHVCLHTAHQMNRGSLSKELVTIQDLAECFEVAAISDIIVAICQTTDEEKEEMIRLFLAKVRDGRDHLSIKYKFWKDMGVFKQQGGWYETPAAGQRKKDAPARAV